jgi:hypothetical protein
MSNTRMMPLIHPTCKLRPLTRFAADSSPMTLIRLKCFWVFGGYITIFKSITVLLTIFCGIFLTFRLNVGIIYKILSVPHNNVVNLNNVMYSGLGFRV